jgi:hypothetical protein
MQFAVDVKLDSRAGRPSGAGCAADMLLLHHEQQPFQTECTARSVAAPGTPSARTRENPHLARCAVTHGLLRPPSGGATDSR